MPKLSLSDLTVKSLKPGLYFDTKTRGFGIRVGKTRRTWLVTKGERSAKVRLGHYPAPSLADARKRALVALGTPYQPSIGPTFIEARDQYLNQGTWRPKFSYQLNRWLRLYFNWKKPLDQITANDVMVVIDAIKKSSERNHAFQSIRALFAWCVPRYLKYSPCLGLKAPAKSTPRDHVLSDAELVRIWKCLDQPATNNLPASYCAIVKLLLLTGQRRGEIAALQPSWIHDDQITIPKGISKNGREHTLPIGPIANKIIRRSTLPFSSSGKKPFNNWTYNKAALDKASSVRGFTLHDLRRTCRTIHARIGTPPHVAERLVNHVSSRSEVEAIYDRHTYFPEMRAAVDRYEGWFAKLCGLPKRGGVHAPHQTAFF